jgi:hypothetical protein
MASGARALVADVIGAEAATAPTISAPVPDEGTAKLLAPGARVNRYVVLFPGPLPPVIP